MEIKKELIQDIKNLGKDQLFLNSEYERRISSNDFQNTCGATIDDIIKRGLFNYIITNQENCDNETFIIDIDFDYAVKFLKFIAFYADSLEYAWDMILSQKYFLENKQCFELYYEIDCCLYKKKKHIIFHNVKVTDSDDFIWNGMKRALSEFFQ